MIHNFIVGVLERVCPDDRVRESLLSVLMGDLTKRYKDAVRQTEFLLHVDRVGTPMTLRDFSKEDPSYGGHEEAGRRKNAEAPVSMSNTRHTVQHIHDILKAYYEVASQRFVDNVCMQATDYHLVTGPLTPMKLFAPSFVTGLTAEQLENLAGEEAGVRRKRGQLKKGFQELEAGRKIVL
ncbi:DYNc [Aspergillus sp. HF37]|nr:DYNc [Aspergillus sp. HF37]